MTSILAGFLAPVLETIQTLFHDHWPKIAGVALTAVPVLWGVFRAWRQWRTREFMSRFSVSLNVVRQDAGRRVLWLPAAEEMELEEVFHRNRTAVRIVRRAAYATTPTEPFLRTISVHDRGAILNEVGNRVEVMLREGSFLALAGLPVRLLSLVVGLSCEKGADVRIRKIRALVVEEGLLRNVNALGNLQFDKPHHAVRYQTLRHMSKLYAEQPDLFSRITVALRLAETPPVPAAFTGKEVPDLETAGAPKAPTAVTTQIP